MNKCIDTEIQEMLPDLLHGSLGERPRREVEAHLVGCESCREDLNVIRAVKSAAVSREARILFLSRCSVKPPRPQPKRAIEIAMKAKWYQMVAEKTRVRPISSIKPESVIRKTPALTDMGPY